MQSNLPGISPIARAYAQALLEVAHNAGQLDDVAADLASLKALCEALPEMIKFLKAASVSTEEKRRVLAQALEPVLNPLTFRTIQSMARRNRLEYLYDLVDAFAALLEERKNRVTVELISPRQVSPEQQASLEQAISGKLGKQVILRTRQMPELIGGGQLRIGDLLIDGSVRYRLQQMRRHLGKRLLLTLNEKIAIS